MGESGRPPHPYGAVMRRGQSSVCGKTIENKGQAVQDLSFDAHDPVFRFNGLAFSVQIFTFENVYGLDGAACTVTEDTDTYTVTCRGLTWAGGQETCEGAVHLRAAASEGKTIFSIDARCAKTIRCVKLVVREMADGRIVNLREADAREIGPDGLILTYPNGWRGLYTPQVILKGVDGALTNIRSLDTRVRAKRFAFVRTEERLTIELIHEELATEATGTIIVPPWEIGPCEDRAGALAEHTRHVAHAYGLVPWEERGDVPPWARDIALVAAIHCQHFTGYVFNDYARVLDTIRWLAARIEPRRVLVYLPGWEGRYYWQYGAYRPDPRMGGEEGFAHLVAAARAIGVHVMPMFGINIVNKDTENYERWGAPAAFTSAGGNPMGGSVDWDGSRHYDHGWGSLLNPGAPTWRATLASQIRGLIERYGFDGVFLDISAAWWNDPTHDVGDGTRELVARIRDGHPEILVAGEGWYDAVGGATPLMQSGHTEGVLHWHDVPYAPLFDAYNRSFAHLCLGDPSRGSTGAHELGRNPITRAPLRKGIIPTVTIVDDTLAVAPDRVGDIIEDAKRYTATYLQNIGRREALRDGP